VADDFTIEIPVLDQGNVGSCTGHAGAATIASDTYWSTGKQFLATGTAAECSRWAVALYSDATRLDPWPGVYEPEDTGSDGLSIAKVLHARGLISGYQHATSLAAALTGLAERVVMVGTTWMEGMYDVGGDGHMAVRGAPLGGHEYVLDELDVTGRRVWMRNSWGEGWGMRGRAWMTWDELGALLADYGDCTILVPKTEPAPQPQPEPPPKPAKDAALAAALEKYLDNRNAAKYLRAAAEPWLADFSKE
jgi:hypothetical protein